jgi:hypothetical protein
MTYEQILNYYNYDVDEVEGRREQIENLYFNAIVNAPLETIEDLLRIINMVYAWMPTMLKETSSVIDFENIDFNELLQIAQEVRRGEVNKPREIMLMSKLGKLTNNHMVGASKVLMVLNQDKYPIFDSRVLQTWNNYVIVNNTLNEIKTLSNYSIENNPDRCIDNYLYYKNTVQHYARVSNKRVRQYEFLLFYINGKMNPQEKLI